MSETKHTPGPWFEYGLSIYASDGVPDIYIAEMAYGDGPFEASKEQALANAHLIEAAPDLLLCASALVAQCDLNQLLITPEFYGAVEYLRLAIAKAHGEALP